MDEDADYFAPDAADETAPKIPTFFQPTDLPDWLRAPLPAAATLPRRESARARQAWASMEGAETPAETGEFQTAGETALTRLVPAQPARLPRKRRGIFGIGIGAAFPLVACVV